ncbi:protein lurp-one-related 7 [Quercus suber]|uniref:Protein lurp-one-related 7 n=1 Tax=Quercus suber TaxID=58331 RepID=A0AAW0JZR0_QUESU
MGRIVALRKLKSCAEYTLKNVKEKWAIVEDGEDSAPKLKVKGFPFQKSCTIYRGNDIVAQVQAAAVYAKRNKFRLNIFPGSADHALVAALVVIFLD